MKGIDVIRAGFGLILIATAVHADDHCERWTCDEVKAEIREIEAHMRSGYTAAQGLRYEERLRELKDCRHRLCR